MKPRFRVVSEDGITTHVYDLETGEDISEFLTGIKIEIKPQMVLVSLEVDGEAVEVDVSGCEALAKEATKVDA